MILAARKPVLWLLDQVELLESSPQLLQLLQSTSADSNAPMQPLTARCSTAELAAAGQGFFFDSARHALFIRPAKSDLGSRIVIKGLSSLK